MIPITKQIDLRLWSQRRLGTRVGQVVHVMVMRRKCIVTQTSVIGSGPLRRTRCDSDATHARELESTVDVVDMAGDADQGGSSQAQSKQWFWLRERAVS